MAKPKLKINEAKKQLWEQGILSWKLHSAQRLIYDLIKTLPTEQREALVFCSRSFGKSFLGVVLALEDCLQNPGVQVAIVGPNLKQTKKIVTPLLKLIITDAPEGLIKQHKSTDTWLTNNGSILTLAGYDTAKESLRGQTLFNIYLEETGFSTADLEEYVYILYSILMPTLRARIGARLTHLTSAARVIDHPLHLETLPKCKMANAFYKFTIEDNPRLTPEQIALEIETMGGRDSIIVRRELFCEIVRDDSITVVTTFNEAAHVSPISPSHPLKYAVGGDLGYTNDLSVFLLAGYDHNAGKVIIENEKWFTPNTPTAQMVKELEAFKVHKPTFIVDIQGNTRTDMSILGLDTAIPIKDKFDSTITFLRNEFYQNKIVIHPNCKLLIETLRSQIFNKHKTDFQRTISLGHADALMALVYLLRSIDRITDLRPRPSYQTHHIPPKPTNPLASLIG
jgi:hypothetical protein